MTDKAPTLPAEPEMVKRVRLLADKNLGERACIEHIDALRQSLLAERGRAEKEIADLKYEAAWIRKKFGLPEDTPMFTGGGPTLAGKMHVLHHQAHGYVAYIEAYKCDDKQGEIARLTVRAEKSEKDAARLDHLEKFAVIAKPGQPIREAIDEQMAAIDAAIKGAQGTT